MKAFRIDVQSIYRFFSLLVVLAAGSLALAACQEEQTMTEPTATPTRWPTTTPRDTLAPPTATPTTAPVEWELVWSDEFDGDGLPDSQRWDYEEGFIRNNEAQYYTRERPENARLEGGNLVIEARQEAYQGAEITSASLVTKGKAEWTYGRFEVRAKLPTGRGTWPAIWMLGVNIDEVGWPMCGEIDIMENVGYDPNWVHGNIHTEAYNHVKQTNKGNSLRVEQPFNDFHVYAVEWHPEHIDIFLDGEKYFTFWNEYSGVETWPYDLPHYLILNLAIGGSWGGLQGIDDSIFPQQFLIDYVRVYQVKQ